MNAPFQYDPNSVALSHERFNELIECEKRLRALEAAGVDNWEGYDAAMRTLTEDKE